MPSSSFVAAGAKTAHLTEPVPACQLRQVELSATSLLGLARLIPENNEASRGAFDAKLHTWMQASSLPETMNCESLDAVARIWLLRLR